MKLLTLSSRLISMTLLVYSSVLVAQASPAIDTPQQASQVFLPLVSRGRPLLNDAVASIEPAATGSTSTFFTPMDATPDPDANNIYFTALSDQGAGIFKVPAAGGAVVTITVGGPLTVPFGLAVNASGQTIYVADTSAPVTTTQVAASGVTGANCGGKQGGIFSIPIGGGALALVAGTGCTAPRGITVITENGGDMIYFTGVDPSDDQPAVMKIPANGGSLLVLDKGAHIVDPVGITVAQDSRVYVTDQAADGNGLGAVYRIKQGGHDQRSSHNEKIAGGLRMGNPAGLALTLDESNVLISALAESAGTSQVVVINTTTLEQGIVNTVIGENHASGGLHRAQNSNVLAWCGVTAGSGGAGTVFRVELN